MKEMGVSNFKQMTKHPKTGEFQMADWLDNHFGHHRYGVRFPNGQIFRETEIDAVEVNGVGAETSSAGTTVIHWDGKQERPA